VGFSPTEIREALEHLVDELIERGVANCASHRTHVFARVA
jgi:hypothetical protein